MLSAIPDEKQQELRMFILSDIKETILRNRSSEEGSPNDCIGLLFSTDPEGSAIEFSTIIIAASESDSHGVQFGGVIRDLSRAVVAERDGGPDGIYAGLKEFLSTQVRGATLIGVFVANGVNTLNFAWEGLGDDSATGIGVRLILADRESIEFLVRADGVVPIVVSSAELPVSFIRAAPRGPEWDIDNETLPADPNADVPFELALLFDVLTVTDEYLEG